MLESSPLSLSRDTRTMEKTEKDANKEIMATSNKSETDNLHSQGEVFLKQMLELFCYWV